MAKINLERIADELAASEGLSKKAARAYARFVFDAVTEHLADGDEVLVKNFGKFDTTVYAARKGRNIRTGEDVAIPPKHRIRFEMSRNLLDAFNGRPGET